MVRKLRITQNRTEQNRLAFVKALKDVSGFGLKEAKDSSDSLHYKFQGSPVTIEITLDGEWGNKPKTIEDINNFRKAINENCTGSYTVNGGAEWERETKLLSLGIGSDSDYVNSIANIMMVEKSHDDIEKFIIELLSTKNREELEKIFNKLIKEENNGERLDTF